MFRICLDLDIGRGGKEYFNKCSVWELGMSLKEWGVHGREVSLQLTLLFSQPDWVVHSQRMPASVGGWILAPRQKWLVG